MWILGGKLQMTGLIPAEISGHSLGKVRGDIPHSASFLHSINTQEIVHEPSPGVTKMQKARSQLSNTRIITLSTVGVEERGLNLHVHGLEGVWTILGFGFI